MQRKLTKCSKKWLRWTFNFRLKRKKKTGWLRWFERWRTTLRFFWKVVRISSKYVIWWPNCTRTLISLMNLLTVAHAPPRLLGASSSKWKTLSLSQLKSNPKGRKRNKWYSSRKTFQPQMSLKIKKIMELLRWLPKRKRELRVLFLTNLGSLRHRLEPKRLRMNNLIYLLTTTLSIFLSQIIMRKLSLKIINSLILNFHVWIYLSKIPKKWIQPRKDNQQGQEDKLQLHKIGQIIKSRILIRKKKSLWI